MSECVLPLLAEEWGILRGTLSTTLAILEERGCQPVLFFGTLLGTIRNGDSIPWDTDADLLVKDEMFEEAAYAVGQLGSRGYAVGVDQTARRMTVRPFTSNHQVDIFTAVLTSDGRWQVPGWPPFEWDGARTMRPLRGIPLPVPTDPELVLRGLYGAEWRVPFAAYWQRLYSERTLTVEPSSFALWVAERLPAIDTMLELGCGNGRDAIFFSKLGHRVFAGDPIKVAVEAAEAEALAQSVGDGLTLFYQTELDQVPEEVPTVDVVYLRWVLHAMTPVTAARVIWSTYQRLRPGGKVFVEVRADPGDPDAVRLFDGGYLAAGHYRRPYSRGDLRAVLASAGYRGISVGAGTSIYGDETAQTWRATGDKA